MSTLAKLIQNKLTKQFEHKASIVKLDACIDALLISGKEHSRELEILEKNEAEASKNLRQAEEELINYQPESAQEYGQQTCALINDITGNNFYLQAMKRGAEALASGGLK